MEKKLVLNKQKSLSKYDALRDKHASFYFNGYGIKKHLRKLKKAIQMEPQSRTYKQYTSMLTQKLNEIDKQSQSAKYKIQPYESILKPNSLYKLQRMQTIFDQTRKHNSLRKNIVSPKTNQNSTQQLPNLSKIKCTDRGNTTHLQSDVFKQPINKTTKTMSVIQNSIMRSKMQQRKRNVNLCQEKDNRSLLVKKRNESTKTFRTNKLEMKEIKHEQFVSFLKKRQQMILNHSKKVQYNQPQHHLKQRRSKQI